MSPTMRLRTVFIYTNRKLQAANKYKIARVNFIIYIALIIFEITI
nr:hypothetical protein TnSNPV_96 [Trichoplusia ni single nucleopolyhedrovirus]